MTTAATDVSSFPRRKAVTRNFRLGAPRNFSIAPGGQRVFFLRSAGPTTSITDLWSAGWESGELVERRLVDAAALLGDGIEHLSAAERAQRERTREVSGGITGYSADRTLQRVCFVLSGQLFCHFVESGETRLLDAGPGLANPRLDPTGEQVTVTRDGDLVLVSVQSGHSRTLARAEWDTQSWGDADFIAAEEMGRYHGSWWAPDGRSLLAQRTDVGPVERWYLTDASQPDRQPVEQRYPVAGSTNASVSLHLFTLTAGSADPGDGPAAIEIDWDHESFEYLARVHWEREGDPIIAVQNRSQTDMQIRAVDTTTGDTHLLEHEVATPWVELIPGLPRQTAAGLASAEVDTEVDRRRLVIRGPSGQLRTPPHLHVVAVTGDDAAGITLLAHEQDPAEQSVWRLDWQGHTTRISGDAAWATGIHRDGTSVIVSADQDTPSSRIHVHTSATAQASIKSLAEIAAVRPRPVFLQDGGWSRIAILLPTGGAPAPLPIIMSPYGGPHGGRSIKAASAYVTEQWLADQGYCVVVADGPGSPSFPANETAIHRDLATGPLAGQVDALSRVVEHLGDAVDSSRVGIRGWSFGGYLAALAVLDRPDLFHAAVAGAPVTEWGLYDTHYTERYLGTPQAHPDAYARSDLTDRAPQLRRPLLLIHGLADDNVVVAHTLRLSRALLAAGRPHRVLPLAGVTHMTPQESIAENLLLTELDFFSESLSGTTPPQRSNP